MIVEASNDLKNWNTLAISENGSELSGEGTLEVVSQNPHTTTVETEEDTAEQQFYRIRIEQASDGN